MYVRKECKHININYSTGRNMSIYKLYVMKYILEYLYKMKSLTRRKTNYLARFLKL